jgi:hypothetical protein
MMFSSHLSEIADISPMVGDLGLIRFKNIRIPAGMPEGLE